MLSIRLSRRGAKKRPFYHIVATDSRKPRDSGYIESLGFFNPGAAGRDEILRIDQERLEHWLARGGKMSERVKHLYKCHVKEIDLRARLDSHREAADDRVRKMREEAEKAWAAKVAEKQKAAEESKAEGEEDKAPAEAAEAAEAPAKTETEAEAAEAKAEGEEPEAQAEEDKASVKASAEAKPEGEEAEANAADSDPGDEKSKE